jgi:hypothetical protein
MKLIILAAMLAIGLSACGKSADTSAANTANSKTANSSNVSNSSSETNKDAAEKKDMSPLTMPVSDIVVNYDPEKEGRTVTVTGGRLEKMERNSLLIRDGAGPAFYCYGDFSDYMSGAPKIDQLQQQGKPPVATVKGTYKKGNGSGADLGPCVLMDLGK